jgi:hypothetical protein
VGRTNGEPVCRADAGVLPPPGLELQLIVEDLPGLPADTGDRRKLPLV